MATVRAGLPEPALLTSHENDRNMHYNRIFRMAVHVGLAGRTMIDLIHLMKTANSTGKAPYSPSTYSVTSQRGRCSMARAHIGIDGHYRFHLPGLGGAHLPLCDPGRTRGT